MSLFEIQLFFSCYRTRSQKKRIQRLREVSQGPRQLVSLPNLMWFLSNSQLPKRRYLHSLCCFFYFYWIVFLQIIFRIKQLLFLFLQNVQSEKNSVSNSIASQIIVSNLVASKKELPVKSSNLIKVFPYHTT